MKKRTTQKRTTQRKKTARKPIDLQLHEFETRDLGKDILASKSMIVVRKERTQPTSIVLEESLVRGLREAGAKRGLGYQTMLKLIVREHLHEY